MNKTIGIINNPANRSNIKKFTDEGFEIILIPNLLTAKNTEINFDLLADNLLDFDWLIFTDIFSVDYFIDELIKRDFDLYELDNLRICAFGEIVADRLRFSQIHSDVIPRNLSSKIILEDLKNYIASDNDISELSFLIIKAENNIDLSKELRNICKIVTQCSIYSANIKEIDDILKIRILINSGAFDEIIFFSAEDLHSFIKIAGLESLKNLSQLVKLTSKNETILKSIEELKF